MNSSEGRFLRLMRDIVNVYQSTKRLQKSGLHGRSVRNKTHAFRLYKTKLKFAIQQLHEIGFGTMCSGQKNSRWSGLATFSNTVGENQILILRYNCKALWEWCGLWMFHGMFLFCVFLQGLAHLLSQSQHNYKLNIM